MLRTAEQLFAARGVDAVSLREIAEAAGQRNHSAALYHFGDKRQLVESLLHRHSGPIDDALLRDVRSLEASGNESLESLVRLMVTPLVAKLDDADGGPEYLQVCAELVSSRSFPITGLDAANGPGSIELRARLLVHMHAISPAMLPLRMLRTAAVLFCSIAAYLRLREAGLHVARRDFQEDLVDSICAMFGAKTRRTEPGRAKRPRPR